MASVDFPKSKPIFHLKAILQKPANGNLSSANLHRLIQALLGDRKPTQCLPGLKRCHNSKCKNSTLVLTRDVHISLVFSSPAIVAY